MKRGYLVGLLILVIPIAVLAKSEVAIETSINERNISETPKRVSVIYDNWNECKKQGDIVGEKVLLNQLSAEQSGDLVIDDEYTFIYCEKIGATDKVIATYEQVIESSYIEEYPNIIEVIFDSWDECKKQGDKVKGAVFQELTCVEHINLEKDYFFTGAKRIKGESKVVATYKLQ